MRPEMYFLITKHSKTQAVCSSDLHLAEILIYRGNSLALCSCKYTHLLQKEERGLQSEIYF